MSRFMEMHNE